MLEDSSKGGANVADLSWVEKHKATEDIIKQGFSRGQALRVCLYYRLEHCDVRCGVEGRIKGL